MGSVRAVILDIDGTLLLSNEAHARAFVEAAAALGIAGAQLETVRRLIGKGGDKLIPEAFGFAAESADGKRLAERKDEIFQARYLGTLQPAPGARSLLSRLRGGGIRLVVATSAGKDDIQALLQQAQVQDLVPDAASADDVSDSKPDPDVVQAALKKLALEPGAVVMLGDTPYDVEAARRAGVAAIAVRCGGWGDRDLQGAQAIYDDPADLLAHYDEVF